jgi:hypothetical protein
MTDDRERELRRQAERRADAKIGFRIHLLVYLLVNAGLLAINLLTTPGQLWFFWPMIGWGIGLAAHGTAVFAGGGDMRERAIEAELRRLRERGV